MKLLKVEIFYFQYNKKFLLPNMYELAYDPDIHCFSRITKPTGLHNLHRKSQNHQRRIWRKYLEELHPLDQGIIRRRKCRMSTETPKYQLGWAVLAVSRPLDNLKSNLHFISPNLNQYITLRVHIINSQSTVPPLRSSLW